MTQRQKESLRADILAVQDERKASLARAGFTLADMPLSVADICAGVFLRRGYSTTEEMGWLILVTSTDEINHHFNTDDQMAYAVEAVGMDSHRFFLEECGVVWATDSKVNEDGTTETKGWAVSDFALDEELDEIALNIVDEIAKWGGKKSENAKAAIRKLWEDGGLTRPPTPEGYVREAA